MSANWAAVAVLAASACFCSTARPDDRIPPEWTFESVETIEWLEIVHASPDVNGVLFSAADRITLLDGKSGRLIWQVQRPTLRGVRFAGAAADFVAVWSSSAVLALTLSPATGGPMRWTATVGEPFTSAEPRDPEFLAHVVAALAMDDGVVALRSDGALLRLAAPDGSTRYTARLAPARSAALFRTAAHVGAWTPGGGGLRLLILDLAGLHPVGTSFAMPASVPLFAGVSGGEAIAVWPTSWGRFDVGGNSEIHEHPDRVIPSAGAAAIVPGLAGGAGRLVLPTRIGGVAALDLETGKIAWESECTSGEALDSHLRALEYDSGRLLVGGEDHVEFLDAMTGATIASDVLDGAWDYGWLDRDFGVVLSRRTDSAEYSVLRVDFSTPPGSTRRLRLDSPTGSAGARFAHCGETLLILGDHDIAAYEVRAGTARK